MFRNKRNAKNSALRVGRLSAARLRPLASSTGTAAEQAVHKTRAWLAPQAEHAGRAVQQTIAPKVSAALSSAARRIDPKTPSRRRWSKRAGLAGLGAAAAGIATVIRNRAQPQAANESGAGDLAPAEAADEPGEPGEPTKINRQVRTS